jgi:hypothetical protein
MDFTNAHALLARSLGDSDAAVRSGAITAMRMAAWQEAFRQPVTQCVLGESDSQVKSLCLELHTRHGGAVGAN